LRCSIKKSNSTCEYCDKHRRKPWNRIILR
jgi:hypothetical protein